MINSAVVFENGSQMGLVCGPNDRNLPYMETLLGCDIRAKGNTLEARCRDEVSAMAFSRLVSELKVLAEKGSEITENVIFMESRGINLPHEDKAEEEVRKTISVFNKSVYPKTPRQKAYVEAMDRNQIVFSVGPAGTGKTFLAVSHALAEVLSGKKQKIILTRPVVEAGESLGFLPGDLQQKLNPYLRPLYDAMESLIPPALIKRLEDSGSIEIAPLAYMRGRSLHNAVVILDEAQNTTKEQMQMLLTRIGENSTAVITGDVTQIDLPRNKMSGLVHAIRVLKGIDGIAFIRFDGSDVVRARIIQRIIDAYAKDEELNV